ncbi:BTB domain-containing protein [Mycena chlorophos]|uniref:BTB domain-containing protein n=1 Tax=Mycena chlorophos TaxID=658473 RepID=A0A8H6VQK2_MYCCL|nr:BTB domain-containing protein [Mycena chlorophos]
MPTDAPESTPTLTPKDAPAPFAPTGTDSFAHTRPSDFILRSSDGVDFHVHKESLKFASDVFQDMFAVVAPNSAENDAEQLMRDGKPVLQLDEPQRVIYKLLCFAYPVARSAGQVKLDVNDIDPDLVDVFRAAHKYQFVVLEEMLKTTMNEFAGLPSRAIADPYRIFAIGKLLGHRELAKAAILAATGRERPKTLNFPELRLLSWLDGEQIHRLAAEYKHKMHAALDAAANVSRLGTTQPVWTWRQHSESIMKPSTCTFVEPGPSNPLSIPCAEWFLKHIEQLKAGALGLPYSQITTKECIQALSPSLRTTIASFLSKAHSSLESEIDAVLA